MKCPSCGHSNDKVLESRELEDGLVMRRRRQCLRCANRFTTYERIETPIMMVVKKNGERELFSRDKLASGLYKALEKRPIAADRIESAVDEIESDLRQRGLAELLSSEIGELVMDRLRGLDQVAYVRFASVYRRFADLDSFARTIEQLRPRAKKGSKTSH